MQVEQFAGKRKSPVKAVIHVKDQSEGVEKAVK